MNVAPAPLQRALKRRVLARMLRAGLLQAKRALLALACACVALVALVMLLSGSSSGSSYMLVVDAGSSGTRIYAFAWQPRPAGGPVLLSAVRAPAPRKGLARGGMYDRVETQPGLATLMSEGPAALEAKGLQPLLSWARAALPRRRHRCTPVALRATAGARRLPASQQAALLGAVRRVLATSGFLFEPSWASVASGAEEGGHGWVALAAGRGMVPGVRLGWGGAGAGGGGGGGQAGVAAGQQGDNTRASPLVVLDLGGSSLELTTNDARVLQGQPHPPVELVNVTLGAAGAELLYSQTYARLGLTDTWDRAASVLIQEQLPAGEQHTGPVVLKHPCLHEGFGPAKYERLHVHSGAAPGLAAVELVGAPDADKCRRLAAELARPVSPCGTAGGASGGHGCPPLLQGDHIALTGFYVVSQFLATAVGGGAALPTGQQEQARKLCSMPWSQVTAKFSEYTNVERYCLWAHYTPQLLEGRNVSQEKLHIGTKDMGWPVGLAVDEVAKALAGEPGMGTTALAVPGCKAAAYSLGSKLLWGAALVVLVLACVRYAWRTYTDLTRADRALDT